MAIIANTYQSYDNYTRVMVGVDRELLKKLLDLSEGLIFDHEFMVNRFYANDPDTEGRVRSIERDLVVSNDLKKVIRDIMSDITR